MNEEIDACFMKYYSHKAKQNNFKPGEKVWFFDPQEIATLKKGVVKAVIVNISSVCFDVGLKESYRPILVPQVFKSEIEAWQWLVKDRTKGKMQVVEIYNYQASFGGV